MAVEAVSWKSEKVLKWIFAGYEPEHINLEQKWDFYSPNGGYVIYHLVLIHFSIFFY